MAVNLTSTGVDFLTGRGKNKTVTLSMTFKELERWAARQKIDTAKLMTRSFGRACAGLKKKFRQVVQNAGGVNGVPKFKDFDAFTKELRKVKGIEDRPMGGVLADPAFIVSFKRNGWQIIGWPDQSSGKGTPLAEWAIRFQDGGDALAEVQLQDPDWRAYIHRKGIREIPRTYAHNPRRVLPEPFGGYVDQHLEEWAKGALYKGLAKMYQKYAMRKGVA
jgi:hypothetical protein